MKSNQWRVWFDYDVYVVENVELFQVLVSTVGEYGLIWTKSFFVR